MENWTTESAFHSTDNIGWTLNLLNMNLTTSSSSSSFDLSSSSSSLSLTSSLSSSSSSGNISCSPSSSESLDSVTSSSATSLSPEVVCLHKGTSVATVEGAIWFFLLALTCVAICVVVVLMILVLKHRKSKVLKAACPALLLVSLSGMIVLYLQFISAAFLTDQSAAVNCMIQNWVRHLGFGFTYMTIVLKTWRIASIMRANKTRDYLTTNAQICKTTAAMLSVVAIFLLTWTIVESEMTLSDAACRFDWWEIVLTTGEIIFVVWGLWLCYLSRHAPQPYNDTRPLSYALWNELLWSTFYLYARQTFYDHWDSGLFFLVFFRTHGTIAVTLAAICLPKFLVIFCQRRKLKSRVAIDGGMAQIHRLTLALNKNGAVRAIYCVPCGPLVCREPDSAWESESSTSQKNNADHVENHYTRGEVDNLIQMLASLRSECELYKAEAKQLSQLFNASLSEINDSQSTSILMNSDVTSFQLQFNHSIT